MRRRSCCSRSCTAYYKSAATLEARVNEDLAVIVGQLNAAVERQVEDIDRFSTFP
ncbi:MAG TPA: hypothetical protein VEZ72_08560 [Paenibacillus sp.]|nr:hypothetical protein [Paenibacillus sp.]